MLDNIKIGNKLLIVFKNEGEVNSTIIDIIDEKTIIVEVHNEHYEAKIDEEGIWLVDESSEKINESLLRDNSKRQMIELNKIIKKSGGDIHDRVRKSEKKKEDKMPNAFYMDNPFDANRKSIDTWEDFMKKDAHYKSEPMKSRDPKPNRPMTDSKLSKLSPINENISGPLKTMPAHHQTYIYPRLKEDEKILLKKLDFMLYRFNFKNDTKVMMSFKSPKTKDGAHELMLINIQPEILDDVLEILSELNLKTTYDGKGRLFLNVYYYHRKNKKNLNESKKGTVDISSNLKNLKNFYQICMEDEFHPNRVCKKDSDIDDDTWVKGNKEELVKPMFKNLPDAKIRTPYDILRAGKWVNIDGVDVRINSLEKGKVLVDVVDEENKHKTIEYKINDFLKKIRKTNKK